MLIRFETFSSSVLVHTLHSLWIQLIHSCRYFQQQHPLLISALYWITGIISRPYPLCGAILLVALHPFIPKQLKHQLFIGACWLIPLIMLSEPSSIIHGGVASGSFVIKSGKENRYFGEAIHLSYPCGQKHRHVPCTILVDAHLELNKKYHLKGTTLNRTSQIIFKSNGCYKEIQPSRIALLHHKLRETCHRRILNLFSSRESGSFASSLLLGTPLPKHLKDIFKKKGLAHIFAISGWHFSLCASLLFFFFYIFPTKIKYFLTFIILLGFTLLFPGTPSVWRAWISLSLLCLSPFSSGVCSSFNRLGIGCILCTCVFSPLTPAFALSFLATAGILLFFSHLFRFFYTPWKQIAPKYLLPFLRYIWGALSLGLSSQIFLLFPTVNFFGSLPLDGLIFNLFFPLCVLPIFFLILFSLALPCLVPITEFCISWLIGQPCLHGHNVLISLAPSPLSPWQLTLFLIFVFHIGVSLEKTKTPENPSLHSISEL
ncbi:ComEC/Rec2 family competence protein [Chlamydia psittaci]|uniref:ComEC/Rec2 family competence protein n=1 Tax=Chlamydia psittaci TaxID=83554 RepID=UPI00027E19E5|nr:ComEC/Rec2 family competence protein [Chlamydia psittaci]EPJ32011.1 competence family protein [Chlamydia psittaci 06-1683]EPP32032.1 competence family protein [Chlamydia psittaci C1/97]AFS23726.1 comEC/Rec2-related domain protein [Chlamydia psittaci WS/RT/E30]EPP29638.1 competence family protein [Chlamydia psittaci 08-2626_L3]USB81440.1 ComEC/Rec2 family competence protein [Chlamydia psittaci]